METGKQSREKSEFLSAMPILASLNSNETIEFYSENLSFETIYHAPHVEERLKHRAHDIHFKLLRR